MEQDRGDSSFFLVYAKTIEMPVTLLNTLIGWLLFERMGHGKQH